MDTTASYRSTAATNGATPHGGANGYHHLSNGSTSTKTAAVSQYQAKKQRAPAVMRHEGGGWLTGNFVKLSACAAAGVVFGFAAEKAKGMTKIFKVFSIVRFCAPYFFFFFFCTSLLIMHYFMR